jgi:two-component system, sensor histidine kinase RegB
VEGTGGEADRRAELSLGWLVRFRWGAVAGQLLAVAAAEAYHAGGLALAPLLVLVAIQALSNALLASLRHRLAAPRRLCGAALTLDTLLLSGMLYASGGARNPFSVFYLVYITLAAVVLRARWTWFLAALAVGCYGLLFATGMPLGTAHGAVDLGAHLYGMWVAFTLAAVLTASLVAKLSGAIERSDATAVAMRELAGRHERVAAVASLAAGAAHELGTPLATIAVAARELERGIQRLPAAHAARLAEDAALIRSELERCRAILDRLATGAGQSPGEAPASVRVADLVSDLLEGLTPAQRARVLISAPGAGEAVTVARAALLTAVQTLLQNALEAGEGAVGLGLETTAPGFRVRVSDAGPGMSPELLSRVGEPFFSTKPPGRGLGLGVFIARTLSQQMGGRLSLESQVGKGTSATLELPTVAGEQRAR